MDESRQVNSQLRFDGPKAHKTDTESSPEAGVRLNIKDLRFAIDQTVPEEFFGPGIIFPQLEAEGQLLDILIKPFPHPPGQICRAEHGADFSIVNQSPWVQIQ